MMIKSELGSSKLIHLKTKHGFEIVIALRQGAIEFLNDISKYFQVFIFSHIGRDLLFEIIEKVLDPKGKLILKRDYNIHHGNSRVRTYQHPMLKNPNDLLISMSRHHYGIAAHTPSSFFFNEQTQELELRDFLILDRNEFMWP